MALNSRCVILIWLLVLATSGQVTIDHRAISTQVTTVQNVAIATTDQPTSQEATLMMSRFSNPNTIAAVTAGVNPTVGVMEKNSPTPPQTRSSEIFPPATNSTPSNMNSSSSAVEPYSGETPNATTPLMFTATSNLTTMATRLPSTTQNQEVANTSIVTTEKATNVSTHQTQTTQLASTAMLSTASVGNKSATTLPGTSGVATTLASSHGTPGSTARPPIRTTVTKKVRPPPGKPSGNSTVHSKIVAGLIGGALLLMVLGFLLIHVKKQKLHKQQVTTAEWAGPSPFLEDGATNGDVTRRSSNRISLSSFLPQRLSKRLSLIQESSEELQEIAPSTFVGKNQEDGCEREVDNVSENNGTPQFVQEQTSLADAQETNGKSVSETSQQTNNPETAKQS